MISVAAAIASNTLKIVKNARLGVYSPLKIFVNQRRLIKMCVENKIKTVMPITMWTVFLANWGLYAHNNRAIILILSVMRTGCFIAILVIIIDIRKCLYLL